MKTIKEKTYKFEDLSKEAKENAIKWYQENNSLDYDWWSQVYDDAHEIGLEIKSFELDRDSNITGDFTTNIEHVIKLIYKNHGRKCETYKLAQSWKKKLNVLAVTYKLMSKKECVACGNDAERWDVNQYGYCHTDCFEGEIEHEFKEQLLKCYLVSLESDYDYLQSDESAIESIQANDYDFDQDGNRA